MQNSYQFVQVLDHKSFKFSKEESENLMKWYKTVQSQLRNRGFTDKDFRYHKLRFNQNFQLFHADQFMRDLFSSQPAQQIFGYNSKLIQDVKYQRLSTDTINMTFFKILQDKGIMVQPDNYLKQQMEEVIQGINCADRFRYAMLFQQSQYYECFDKSTTDQFLFHIFKRLALGGPVCQWEDTATPLFDMTKRLYKDLVTVGKDQQTGEIKVQSYVFEVKNLSNEVKLWNKDDHPQNWLYVSIDPYYRHANIWYHQWNSFW